MASASNSSLEGEKLAETQKSSPQSNASSTSLQSPSSSTSSYTSTGQTSSSYTTTSNCGTGCSCATSASSKLSSSSLHSGRPCAVHSAGSFLRQTESVATSRESRSGLRKSASEEAAREPLAMLRTEVELLRELACGLESARAEGWEALYRAELGDRVRSEVVWRGKEVECLRTEVEEQTKKLRREASWTLMEEGLPCPACGLTNPGVVVRSCPGAVYKYGPDGSLTVICPDDTARDNPTPTPTNTTSTSATPNPSNSRHSSPLPVPDP